MRAWLAAAVLLTLSLAPPQTAQATEVAVTMPNGGAQLQSPTLAVGALGGNSFPGETLVHTRDRQGKPALKPIADIKIGDEVLAWDELAAHDGQEIQAKTGTSAQRISAKRYEKVSDLITSERERKLVHITLEGGKRITATDGHPFRTSEGWRDAVLLKKGAKLLLMGSGEGDADSAGTATTTATATIEDVRIEVKTTRVYNLEVENLHTFFVGEQGVVVHNGYKDAKPGDRGENADGPFSWIQPGRCSTNKTLKRRWAKDNNTDWPPGHDFDHIGALADGYPDHQSNGQPLKPSDHHDKHRNDRSRWSKR